MFAGPLFVREAITAPRQFKHYMIRSGYAAGLFVLLYTAAQTTFGLRTVLGVGEIARFGSLAFQVFALVQLTLVLFFSTLFSAGRIAQEKDRRTLLMLLMTDLSSTELVLGKLAASLLLVAVLLATSLPLFVLVEWMGGVTLAQIGWALGVCAASAFAAGAWGNLVAYWREKTFQTLAISVLGIVLFLGVVEAVAALAAGTPVGYVVGLLDPYRALRAIVDPLGVPASAGGFQSAAAGCCGMLALLGLTLMGVAINRVRVWNPSRTINEAPRLEDDRTAGPVRRHRPIWANPVIWREIRTRAYGRKIALIKFAYLLLAAFIAVGFLNGADETRLILGMIRPSGFAFIALSLVTLILINAQAVTAFTSERDEATLELLLVTDVSAREFILGKIGGVFFNTKELILIPLALLFWQVVQGLLPLEHFVYVTVGFLVLCGFSTMLGLHSGLTYPSSRTAIANSLGTMFFLFVGIFLCMLLIVQARSSFALQLPCFLVFILGGSLGLWASLTYRNPSPALSLAAGILPFCTFYAITSFLLGQTLGVCLFIAAAYGFTMIAMMVPAMTSFDVALGRTTADRG